MRLCTHSQVPLPRLQVVYLVESWIAPGKEASYKLKNNFLHPHNVAGYEAAMYEGYIFKLCSIVLYSSR